MRALRNIFLPRECVMCKIPDTNWCSDCYEMFVSQKPFVVSEDHEEAILPFPFASFCYYNSGFDVMIRKFKSENHVLLAPYLAAGLLHAVTLLKRTIQTGENVVLVPIPSPKKSVRTRGYDHVKLFSREVERASQGEISCQNFLRQGKKKDQAGKNLRQRQMNIAGSMWVPLSAEKLKREDVSYVLVDDISTTGATFIEAARALNEVGIKVSGAVSFAFVP